MLTAFIAGEWDLQGSEWVEVGKGHIFTFYFPPLELFQLDCLCISILIKKIIWKKIV